MLRSALPFYLKLKLVGDLEAYDFVLHVYDACISNKMIEGDQMQWLDTWLI